MKTTFKVIIAIFALGTVILLGLHLFLQYGLTKAMREVVLPRVKQETGMDIRIEDLSINLPGGRLYLKGVALRNPEGFLLENLASIEKIEVEVDIMSLLKQRLIRVNSVTVEEALVNVIRNQDGELNVTRIREILPAQPEPGRGEPAPESSGPVDQPSLPQDATRAEEPKPLPEVLIEDLECRARVRYVDFKLNQLDIALLLRLSGRNLGTWSDPAAEWGELDLNGSLGDDRNSFVTDLRLGLAPVTNPESLSFDLTGRIMEIDPRLMEELYDDLGIRSAPFGFDPNLHCRDHRFENSSFALNLHNIQLEDKLAERLGGMGSIERLRFPVAVRGTLDAPYIDVQEALFQALGGNTRSLLDAFLKGAAAKEAGLDEPPENMTDAAVEILGEHVEEIGENEAAKKVLKDLAGGESSDTNAPAEPASDVIVDILSEEIEEIGENEVLREGLKGLGRRLFGD
jgi:hypothetical protein